MLVEICGGVTSRRSGISVPVTDHSRRGRLRTEGTGNAPCSRSVSVPRTIVAKDTPMLDLLIAARWTLTLESEWERALPVLDKPLKRRTVLLSRGVTLTRAAADGLATSSGKAACLGARGVTRAEATGSKRPASQAATVASPTSTGQRRRPDPRIDHNSTAAQYALAERP